MGPPPVKSTKKLIKAELEARAKFKLSQKGIESAIVDMINRIDPIEFLAVASGTLVVYDIIISTPEFLASVQKFAWKALFEPFGWEKILWDLLTGQQTVTLTPEQVARFEEARKNVDPSVVIQSFFISYIMVKHSGQIIAGVGNVTGFIGGFLGLKAA